MLGKIFVIACSVVYCTVFCAKMLLHNLNANSLLHIYLCSLHLQTNSLNFSLLSNCLACCSLLSWRQSASSEEGYDRVTWTSDMETHPPWLRFHLGITRRELYSRNDPNVAQLTHYLATQRILAAGEQAKRGWGGLGCQGKRQSEVGPRESHKLTKEKSQRREHSEEGERLLIILFLIFLILKMLSWSVSKMQLLLTCTFMSTTQYKQTQKPWQHLLRDSDLYSVLTESK